MIDFPLKPATDGEYLAARMWHILTDKEKRFLCSLNSEPFDAYLLGRFYNWYSKIGIYNAAEVLRLALAKVKV